MNKFVIMCQLFPGDNFWSQETKLFENTDEGFDKAISFVEKKMNGEFTGNEFETFKKQWKEYGNVSSLDGSNSIRFLILLTKVE